MTKQSYESFLVPYFCVGNIKTYATSLSFEYDPTMKLLPNGLTFSSSTSTLYGTPNFLGQGIYQIKAFLQSTTYTSSATFLLTIMNGNGP